MSDEPINSIAETPKRPSWTWVLIAGVVGLYILGFATTALTSKLLQQGDFLPLIALSPRYRNYIVGAPRIDLVPYLVVGVLRLLVSDPLYFLVGRYFGDGAIRWFERLMGGPNGGGKLVTTTERWFHSKDGKVAIVLSAFFAGPLVCILAGSAKMNPKRFFALDAVGTVVIVLVLRLFAKPLKPLMDWLIKFNGRNWKVLTAIAVVFVIFTVVTTGKDYLKNASSLGKD